MVRYSLQDAESLSHTITNKTPSSIFLHNYPTKLLSTSVIPHFITANNLSVPHRNFEPIICLFFQKNQIFTGLFNSHQNLLPLLINQTPSKMFYTF